MNPFVIPRFLQPLPVPIATVLVLSGCGGNSSDSTAASDVVLAKVNGNPIGEETFRYWWDNRTPAADTAETREAMLERLIDRSSMAQAAREAGLDRDPAFIEQLESFLIARLKETQLQPKLRDLKLPESELSAYYEANLEQKFTEPEHVRVAVLWFNTRGQDPLVARYTPRLAEIRDNLLGGSETIPAEKGFGALAIKNSEHRASRFKGGDVGWLTKDPANDPLRVKVLSLAAPLKEPGDLSAVANLHGGLFLVRLIERRPAHVRPFDEVSSGIERKLLSQRRVDLEEQFNMDIRARLKIERFPENLAAMSDLPERGEAESGKSPGVFSPPGRK